MAALLMLFTLHFSRALRKQRMRSDDLRLNLDKETTPEGCQCTSLCGATSAEGYRCDWCKVPKGCAQWLPTRGDYGFCAYKERHSFTALQASAKLKRLWKSVKENTTVGPLLTKLQAVPKIVSKSMITTFDNTREVLPAHRPKHTHANGVVSLIDLDITSNSTFTGMLRPGVHRGLMRLASARSPQSDSTFPGLAIKMLRSGIHSANVVALRQNGETSGQVHFFEEDLSTHVVPSAVVDSLRKFHQATGCRSMLGISDFCSYDETGSRARSLNFPYRIIFQAPNPMQFAVNTKAKDKTAELLDKLKSIPSGTHLYNLYAQASPTSGKVYLGKLVTRTHQTTSWFGDTKLFFRHQRMEEDFYRHPEWARQVDLPMCDDSEDSQGRLRPLSEWQCPNVDGIVPL